MSDGQLRLLCRFEFRIYRFEFHFFFFNCRRRHFYVRELVEQHRIRVPFVSTVNNIADFFTKPLPPKSFIAFRDRIMNVPETVIESTGGC